MYHQRLLHPAWLEHARTTSRFTHPCTINCWLYLHPCSGPSTPWRSGGSHPHASQGEDGQAHTAGGRHRPAAIAAAGDAVIARLRGAAAEALFWGYVSERVTGVLLSYAGGCTHANLTRQRVYSLAIQASIYSSLLLPCCFRCTV
jgi:hypothetical protein